MAELGVRTLIVTNAAGGINRDFKAGDLMLITDHLGLFALVGGNPLWGPNDETLGPRFLALNNAYDRELRRLALQVAADLGIELRQGVYAGLGGPTFETPAEVRFLRLAGADATGMSTVHEVIVARHMGLRVLGLSGISNATIDDPDAEEAGKPRRSPGCRPRHSAETHGVDSWGVGEIRGLAAKTWPLSSISYGSSLPGSTAHAPWLRYGTCASSSSRGTSAATPSSRSNANRRSTGSTAHGAQLSASSSSWARSTP